ncbi:MAG: tyrosine-type recombinase/integrase [Burkholderiaceae bacterium]|nr:tyrosine-type recombinase/integrase [Burkholderiaceae bacterium]
MEPDVPLPTGLRRDKSGIFHLRIGVPEDVQPYWPQQSNGKMAVDAYRKSLKTRDRSDAVTQAHTLIAEYQRKFAALRDQHRPQFTRLTPKLLAYLQDQIRHTLLKGDDVMRPMGDIPYMGLFSGETRSTADTLNNPERLQLLGRRLREFHAQGDFEVTVRFLDLLLSRIGLPPANWHLYPAYLSQAGRTLASAFQSVADRASGELIDTPPAPKAYEAAPSPAQPQAPETPPKTLRDAVPYWIKATNAKPNAIQRMEYALKLWEGAVGALPIDKITKETGGKFLMYLLDEERGFGRKTAKNHASNIEALMNKAIPAGLVSVNPLDLKFTVDDSENREPWTLEELKLLHDQPITGDQPMDVDAADADLLINMLLWSGARINEIADLRVQDIQERDGIPAAYIRRESTKEASSVRWLPLATALQQKVLAHAARRREEGSQALFPSFQRRAGTRAGDLAGRWFKAHRARLGLPAGPLAGSHKWRHTVRTKLASEGVGEALLDAVTGHRAVSGSAGRKSYTHPDQFPIAKVLEAIERLAWPWPLRPPLKEA